MSRVMLVAAMMAAALSAGTRAQTARALPLDNPGLEHLDIVVRAGLVTAAVLPAADEPDVVRFADNNGLVVEVRVAE